MKTKSFLDKYDTILFDMDGVITSEQGYWTCAAMTVYEMLMSSRHYGDKAISRADMFDNCTQIRREVFYSDKTIAVLKDKGVNSNWDLAYVTLAAALIDGTNDFSRVYEQVCGYDNNIFRQYDILARALAKKFGGSVSKYAREGEFWLEVQNIFQQIYIGDRGSLSMMKLEKPLHGREKTRQILETLKAADKRLGIGTGRPYIEIETPLCNWGVWDLFDKDRIVTYDDVESGEKEMKSRGMAASFTKPHPFMFAAGAFTKNYPVEKIFCGDYKNGDENRSVIDRTLVVGDAGADVLAAQAAGFDFLAVLTGVSGEKARPYFESLKATYILNSICDMVEE